MIDRVPEELRMEVHDIVQEAMIKTIPKKKKCKKPKWLSEEALQIAEKRREVKETFSLVTSCCSEMVAISFFVSFGTYDQLLEGFSLPYIEK